MRNERFSRDSFASHAQSNARRSLSVSRLSHLLSRRSSCSGVAVGKGILMTGLDA